MLALIEAIIFCYLLDVIFPMQMLEWDLKIWIDLFHILMQITIKILRYSIQLRDNTLMLYMSSKLNGQ
jgi:hypothetical protein